MSRKTRSNHRKRIVKAGHWKLIDDRSGMELDNTQVIVDHRGRLTSKGNWDPIHYSELPIQLPTPQPLPVVRPEQVDRFYFSSKPYQVPNTYLDRWYPQIYSPNIPEMTPASNPNANFANFQGTSTFGRFAQNNPTNTVNTVAANTIIDPPTTGRYKSWGDSYEYFDTYDGTGPNLLD